MHRPEAEERYFRQIANAVGDFQRVIGKAKVPVEFIGETGAMDDGRNSTALVFPLPWPVPQFAHVTHRHASPRRSRVMSAGDAGETFVPPTHIVLLPGISGVAQSSHWPRGCGQRLVVRAKVFEADNLGAHLGKEGNFYERIAVNDGDEASVISLCDEDTRASVPICRLPRGAGAPRPVVGSSNQSTHLVR